MKHAYLIIAHHEPNVLKALLMSLDDERNDIFLHIDARSQELFAQFRDFLPKKSRLIVLTDRIAVHWGDLSQVEVEYKLFEKALQEGPYKYYHLLSGVDLPIKSQDHIHHFFQRHAGKEFVGFWNGTAHQKDLHRKVYRYYLFTQYQKEGSPLVHGCTAFLRNLFLAVQKITRYRRRHHMEFRKGYNWVSITHEFCSFLVAEKRKVMQTFKYTLCPDEIFVQTLLWNSRFKENLFNLEDASYGSMRAIDWHRGNPYVWQKKDEKELQNSEMLFARKFSDNYLFKVKDV